MGSDEHTRILKFLQSVVSEDRQKRIEEVLNHRTRYLTVLLENIYHSQNASAVVRTADCFGLQDVHVIENSCTYTLNPHVTRGSGKWVDIHKYSKEDNNTFQAMQEMKAKGYRIAATSPHGENVFTPENIPLDQPLAIMFGTERRGLSDLAFEHADYRLTIPMYGFTESFNISVSAALVLQVLRRRMDEEYPEHGISVDERELLKFEWLKRSVSGNVDQMIESFLRRKE